MNYVIAQADFGNANYTNFVFCLQNTPKLTIMKIQIIAGSPRTKSITFRVALFLQHYLIDKTAHEVGIIDAKEWNLPLLESVFNSIENTPDEWKSLSEKMFSADAFILVSPEYNGSYSSALKNLLDHYPKQHRKVFGIVSGSPGSMGGMRAAQQMQLLVIVIRHSFPMLIVPQADKKLTGTNLVDQLFSILRIISQRVSLAEGSPCEGWRCFSINTRNGISE